MTEPQTWYILQHRPGPAVPAGEAVFDQPGIRHHYEFLQRRLAAGELIAAGPIADDSGEGLTILAVASLDEATRLATAEDQSVADGVLTVVVRPWQVVMARDAAT